MISKHPYENQPKGGFFCFWRKREDENPCKLAPQALPCAARVDELGFRVFEKMKKFQNPIDKPQKQAYNVGNTSQRRRNRVEKQILFFLYAGLPVFCESREIIKPLGHRKTDSPHPLCLGAYW